SHPPGAAVARSPNVASDERRSGGWRPSPWWARASSGYAAGSAPPFVAPSGFGNTSPVTAAKARVDEAKKRATAARKDERDAHIEAAKLDAARELSEMRV